MVYLYILTVLLFTLTALLVYVAYLRKKMEIEVERRVEEREGEIRADAVERSRASLKGKISEHLAPFSDEFEYNASDARFLGSPVDYVIFDGYSDGEDIKVVLADVKTGESARLSSGQREIKKAVDEGRVVWETIAVE